MTKDGLIFLLKKKMKDKYIFIKCTTSNNTPLLFFKKKRVHKSNFMLITHEELEEKRIKSYNFIIK